MAGDHAVELHGKGVYPLGRPLLELFLALKQVDRMHVTETGGLHLDGPISIKRTPLVGCA